eukprot:TRINITY_DN15868_c0_g1_i1.p1 TRINITY_DN15868_c0_g1~~TRINITY_DN15868_c0_g1_i1.p1  ORF type:complete len:307 (+),score=80.65 TRINITY_DN15868_c0_g1_i1:335-1255(+)
MASDSEIAERLKEILKTADLTTTTIKSIRRKLEEDLGIDLSSKKAFIRDQVDYFIAQHQQDDGNAEEDQKQEQQSEDEEHAEAQDEKKPEGEGQSRARQSGFTKLMALSSELQSLLGVNELPRPQVVKQIWVYIRANNLQDPQNKRKILCDDKLRKVFKKDSVDMFEMNKVLSKHIYPIEDGNGSKDVVPKVKHQKHERNAGSDDAESKSKRQKKEKKEANKSKSGFCSPLPLSDALVNFLGTGESELSRAEVVKRIWDYIKEQNLQDPTDKRSVVCDEKLRELFGCERFLGFGVSKLLSAHFKKP